MEENYCKNYESMVPNKYGYGGETTPSTSGPKLFKKRQESKNSNWNWNNPSVIEKRFLQPRAAFNRTYQHLSGLRVREIVQGMADLGKILWVGQDLKWVGTSDHEDEDEDTKKDGVVAGSGTEEDVTTSGIRIANKDKEETFEEEEFGTNISKSRHGRFRGIGNRNQIHFARGFMVEPPENCGKKIQRLRMKLKEEFEQEEDDTRRWEEVIGTDERAVAARYKIHQEWFARQLKKVNPSGQAPMTVGGSTESRTSSGAESDQEAETTDEDDAEIINGTIKGWILPPQDLISRSPSPVGAGQPEFELNEPAPARKKRRKKHEPQPDADNKIYPKPDISFACLIEMALKNSKTGCLPVTGIYEFMCDHFPYFKSAPRGWKNSVRHNLSFKKCFNKIEQPGTGMRHRCLWTVNPAHGKVRKRKGAIATLPAPAMSAPGGDDISLNNVHMECCDLRSSCTTIPTFDTFENIYLENNCNSLDKNISLDLTQNIDTNNGIN